MILYVKRTKPAVKLDPVKEGWKFLRRPQSNLGTAPFRPFLFPGGIVSLFWHLQPKKYMGPDRLAPYLWAPHFLGSLGQVLRHTALFTQTNLWSGFQLFSRSLYGLIGALQSLIMEQNTKHSQPHSAQPLPSFKLPLGLP